MGFYKQHVFICVNQRSRGKKSCQAEGSDQLLEYAKRRVKELNLAKSGDIRLNRAGCLGRCKLGPILVIYPEGVWYQYHTQQDIDDIIHAHLVEGKVLSRLQVK